LKEICTIMQGLMGAPVDEGVPGAIALIVDGGQGSFVQRRPQKYITPKVSRAKTMATSSASWVSRMMLGEGRWRSCRSRANRLDKNQNGKLRKPTTALALKCESIVIQGI